MTSAVSRMFGLTIRELRLSHRCGTLSFHDRLEAKAAAGEIKLRSEYLD